MTSYHEYHQYELENGSMDDEPENPMSTTHQIILAAVEQEREDYLALFGDDTDIPVGDPMPEDMDWPDEPALSDAEQAAVDLEMDRREAEFVADWIRKNGQPPF